MSVSRHPFFYLPVDGSPRSCRFKERFGASEGKKAIPRKWRSGGNVDRPYDDDDGFTMVELMVVVLVIGLLIAIALPTYLGARNRAYNRAAQSNLRSALIGAKAIFSSSNSFVCARATNGVAVPCIGIGMPSVERSLTYQTTASTTAAPNVSIWTTTTAMTWAAARMSKSGTCFGIRDVMTPTGAPPVTATVGTWYGQGYSAANCTGTFAATVANTNVKRWT
jgi:type IV pilus assembly protein PilA